MASFARKKGGRRSRHTDWVSQGWWKIAPGQRRTPWTNVAYTGDIYVHGRTAKRTITSSDTLFCVDNTTSFKLGSADKVACKRKKFKKVGTAKMTTRGGMNTWNFH